jgi:hypothetical protein
VLEARLSAKFHAQGRFQGTQLVPVSQRQRMQVLRALKSRP